MNITIDDKQWRFFFDKDVTLEVIAALYKINHEWRNGINHISLDDLIKYLFCIDMNSLCETSHIVTGLSYYFNGMGQLRSGELYALITNNSRFTVYTNVYNRSIIKMDNFSNISDDHLCTYTERLLKDVYLSFVIQKSMSFDGFEFDELFNTSTVIKRCSKGHIKYLTLDFLIERLELDREGIIEDLSLHNLRLKGIN